MVEFGNIDDLVTSPNLEMAGIDLHLGKGRYVTVRRAGGANREFNVIHAEELRPYEQANSMKQLSDEEKVAINHRIYARAVVIGWHGFKDKAGKPVPFTRENLISFFEQSPPSFAHIRMFADEWSNFRDQQIEEEKDALGKSSPGKPNLAAI